jgi:teichuronic acid biosynthesis glycosyltransferase TuaH
MSGGTPYVVWMANKRWDDHGFDQRMTKEMEHYANILWVDPPVSLVTPAQRRLGAARTVRPVLRVLSERVARLTPAAMPGMTRFGIRATTAPLIRAQVRWALRRMGVTPLAVVSTNLHDVQGRWGSEVVSMLHGTDDCVAGAELMGVSARWVRAQERKAVTNADVVTALSPLLAERWSTLRGSPVPLIPNGCTPVRVSTDRLPRLVIDLPRPVVCMAGRLNARIDMDLLEAIADAGYSLLLVGPHHSQWEQRRFAELITRPGVRYVGRVPEKDAPSYIAAADIGITPYLDSPFNRASFPLKTLDYLIAGRPAVSTDLPAARWLLNDLTSSELAFSPDRILALAASHADFVDALRHIVGDPGQPAQTGPGQLVREPAQAQACRVFAARHTWSRRADALATALGLTAGRDMTPSGHATAR